MGFFIWNFLLNTLVSIETLIYAEIICFSVRGHQGETFYLRKRHNLANYDSILSSYMSAGCTMAPNWQNGATFTVQLTGESLLLLVSTFSLLNMKLRCSIQSTVFLRYPKTKQSQIPLILLVCCLHLKNKESSFFGLLKLNYRVIEIVSIETEVKI